MRIREAYIKKSIPCLEAIPAVRSILFAASGFSRLSVAPVVAPSQPRKTRLQLHKDAAPIWAMAVVKKWKVLLDMIIFWIERWIEAIQFVLL